MKRSLNLPPAEKPSLQRVGIPPGYRLQQAKQGFTPPPPLPPLPPPSSPRHAPPVEISDDAATEDKLNLETFVDVAELHLEAGEVGVVFSWPMLAMALLWLLACRVVSHSRRGPETKPSVTCG